MKYSHLVPSWIKRIRTPRLPSEHIPIYAPVTYGNERAYLLECLDKKWFSSKGEFIVRFEEAFADYCGAPHALACSSGTAALFLGLKALGVGPRDEVIVPTFTMVSTAFVVSYTGARPVFIDCDLASGCVTPESIAESCTRKTKAVIPVHIYGIPCDMDSIYTVAKKAGISVLEDAAEAFGSQYKGKLVGNTGGLAAFSLYVNKIITTGEGGMLTIHSKKIYDYLKHINNYAFSPTRHFWHDSIGYNFRMSNMQAALGLAQLEHADTVLQKKRTIWSWYEDNLHSLADRFKPLVVPDGMNSNYWQISYRVTDGHFDRMELRNYLARCGVETRGFFIPMHLQPVYRNKHSMGQFPNAELLAKTGILLPSGPGLRRDEVDKVCSFITAYFH